MAIYHLQERFVLEMVLFAVDFFVLFVCFRKKEICKIFYSLTKTAIYRSN